MHFVIAGKINCPQFSFAIMVAQRLKENLPDFSYLKISKKPEEWEKWLIRTCQENFWYHVQSPIIWREFGLKKGKKDFIGDINKFFDLCYDYYGVPRDVLAADNFNKEEINWFKNRSEAEFFENIRFEAKKRREYRSRQVCITGASSQIAEIVIMELLQMDTQKRDNGLEIRLFDEPTKEKKLISSAYDGKHCPGPSGFGNCRAVYTLEEALRNVDMVIVLDSFGRKANETLSKWLKRNRNAMCALGKALNKYAPPHCRVIIGSPSTQPICYNATVLASFATKLHVRNIVAVTQDLGREILKPLSTKTNSPLKNFYSPPVWGFIGLNKFIDVRKTLQMHLYKLPGKRLNSTLPQGTEKYELRTSENIITEDDTHELNLKVSVHKVESYPQIGRWPSLAKATAIVDLLKLWGLKQEDGNGEILSLGVYSDGTFNIPRGIYWSQPVILKGGFWVPFADFPIPRSPHFNCFYLLMLSVAAVYRTRVKPRIYIPPKNIPKPKEKKKFNFEKIAEEIGMPVVRTDSECVIYLKFLAKKELGIDLDMVSETIEEEEPVVMPEVEVIKKQTYCECWRQELKELQKIVFDRSSTTEVEVDLSTNISGSEWSVVNLTNSMQDSLQSSETSEQRIPENELKTKNQLYSFSSSSATTICSCEPLPTGSSCRCLEVPEVKGEQISDESKTSMESSYKELSSELLKEENLQEAVFEDSYDEEKHVTFDKDAKAEDNVGFQLKFYGKKDAIRDTEMDLKMKKKVLRYERGGEMSSEEGEGGDDEEKGETPTDFAKTDVQDPRFQISIQGAPYDIIGNRDGLQKLEDPPRSVLRKHLKPTFREIYVNDSTPSIQVIPSDSIRETESTSEHTPSFFGEDRHMNFENITEFPGEQFSIASLREEFDAIWGEGLFHEESEKEEFEKEREEQKTKKKRKWEGIPLCCLCRCIVPEGLPCCPCGATTVVEVFKKESVEVIIQSEDNVSYRLEYYETPLQPESKSDSELSFGIWEEEVPRPELPPESFLPFSPKPVNRFKGVIRPFKLTKEYANSLKKKENPIPSLCSELLNMAKAAILEEETKSTEEQQQKEDLSEDDKTNMSSTCAPEEVIKTDFSNMNIFLPNGLEDWRLTVQKKYREWFFKGPKIKDDAYYDISIEEVSEDEFEVDKEIEEYFEK